MARRTGDLTTLAAMLSALALAGAAHAQDVIGEWHGTLANATAELRLGLEITAKPGGGYEGRMISPDQSPAWLPLDNITLQDGRLRIAGSRVAGRVRVPELRCPGVLPDRARGSPSAASSWG